MVPRHKENVESGLRAKIGSSRQEENAPLGVSPRPRLRSWSLNVAMVGISLELLIFLGAGLVLLYLIEVLLRKSLSRIPPGPRGLPLLGYYPFLGERPFESLAKLKRKYGGVFGLYLGQKYCVVLEDVDALKEAYNKDEFHGRPPDSPFKLSNTTSLIEVGGQQWTDQRRFSLRVLRNLGFGKTRMEDVIKHEVQVLVEEYERTKEKRPELLHDLLAMSTANVISVLLFGRHLPYSHPRRLVIDRYLAKISHFHNQISVHTFFPWTRKLLISLSLLNYGVAKDCIAQLLGFNWREINRHKESLDPDNLRDYVDSFLLESEQRGPDDDTFTMNALNGNIGLFLRAGSLTTRTTVEWALLASAVHPRVQKRVHREIDEVVGRGRTPDWSDKDRMPYTLALLMETQRWRTVVPINILRYTTHDTSVKGYDVPAGTVVISNLWSIHNDTEYWDEPEKFKPERMLTSDGLKLIKTEAFVSFSTGRRACPGQALANMEMFLYFATLLQRYRVATPPGEKPDLSCEVHITCHPKNLRLLLIPRN